MMLVWILCRRWGLYKVDKTQLGGHCIPYLIGSVTVDGCAVD